MRQRRTPEQRAFGKGVFHGKFGLDAAESPYEVADRSVEALAWRRGFVLGNSAFRRAIAEMGATSAAEEDGDAS